jgi:fatty-acyl-CoA synthase
MRFAAADWVAHYARTQPAAIALRNYENGETRTWAELDARVGQIAHTLVHCLGLSPGERIVNLSDGDLRHFELQFACARAGLIWAPLNFRNTASELAAMCEDLRPALMITDAVWQDLASQVAQAAAIGQTIRWDRDGELDAMLNPVKAVGDRFEVDPDAPLQILFTSGTTGKPKAAIITLSGIVWQALNQTQFCATSEPGCHVFLPIPLFHAGGLNSLANPVLYFGGQVTVSPRFDPAATCAYIGNPAHAVSHMALPPVMYQMMADSAPFASANFSSLRRLICAGGRLTDGLRAAYAAKGVGFITQYGGTETGPTVTSMNPDRLDKISAGSCGQKAMHIEVRLVDGEGADVPAGAQGEIWVRGPSVIGAYLGAEARIERPEGWLRTGDIAWEDDEGFYYIVDRVKDMYKSGGENVSPAEVEQVLLSHPAVLEVAVIGVADERWGEVGLAIVAPAKGQTVTLEELRGVCDGKIARYKHPKHLVIVEAFPRNVTGKIAKHELRAQYRGSKSA